MTPLLTRPVSSRFVQGLNVRTLTTFFLHYLSLSGDNILSPKEFTEAPWIFDAGGITLIDSVPEPSMDGPLETDKDPLP